MKDWYTDHRYLRAFGVLLRAEGGFADNPNDVGGRTIFGIAEAYHPEAWEDGPPDLEEAADIYFEDYWIPSGAAQIEPFMVAYLHFDQAVNRGPGAAVRILQEAVNLFRPDAEDIAVDGRFGPQTAEAVNDVRYPRALAVYMVGGVVERIEERIREAPSQMEFLATWGHRMHAALTEEA